MKESFELWNSFEKSGEISDYLKFKEAYDGQGNKNSGTGDTNQRL